MKAPVWRSKRVTTPSLRTVCRTGSAELGVAQELRLVQVVLLADGAELGAVLFEVLVEPALVGEADAGAPAARRRRAGVGCGRTARDVAGTAVGDVGPVEEDRGRRQRRREQATPGQGARADNHGAIVRRP